MNRDLMVNRIREQLLGGYFSTKTELRHLAERVGLDFVPVNFLSEGETEAIVALSPRNLGEIRVRAVREASWQRFFIVAVDPA